MIFDAQKIEKCRSFAASRAEGRSLKRYFRRKERKNTKKWIDRGGGLTDGAREYECARILLPSSKIAWALRYYLVYARVYVRGIVATKSFVFSISDANEFAEGKRWTTGRAFPGPMSGS